MNLNALILARRYPHLRRTGNAILDIDRLTPYERRRRSRAWEIAGAVALLIIGAAIVWLGFAM